jgi:hypothetical protein
MFGRFSKDHSKENRNTVIGSQVVAKAVTRLPSGSVEIIVVFARSTRLEFYWVFRARSPRSARRSWKFVGYEKRDFPFGQKPYNGFVSFVEYHARVRGAQIVSLRIPHKRSMNGLLKQTAHESIFGNWTVQDPNTIRTDKLQRRALNARRGYAWRGGR